MSSVPGTRLSVQAATAPPSPSDINRKLCCIPGASHKGSPASPHRRAPEASSRWRYPSYVPPERRSCHARIAPPAPSLTIDGTTWPLSVVVRRTPLAIQNATPPALMRRAYTRDVVVVYQAAMAPPAPSLHMTRPSCCPASVESGTPLVVHWGTPAASNRCA